MVTAYVLRQMQQRYSGWTYGSIKALYESKMFHKILPKIDKEKKLLTVLAQT